MQIRVCVQVHGFGLVLFSRAARTSGFFVLIWILLVLVLLLCNVVLGVIIRITSVGYMLEGR